MFTFCLSFFSDWILLLRYMVNNGLTYLCNCCFDRSSVTMFRLGCYSSLGDCMKPNFVFTRVYSFPPVEVLSPLAESLRRYSPRSCPLLPSILISVCSFKVFTQSVHLVLRAPSVHLAPLAL